MGPSARPSSSSSPHTAGREDYQDSAREDSPLLPKSTSRSAHTSPDPTPSPSSSTVPLDPTAVYAKILKDHLPWHKRPSAMWLFPIFGVAAISGGLLLAPLGQFQIELLCREYMNRHTVSNATTTTTGFLGGSSSSDLAATMLTWPSKKCDEPEIQAFTAKTMAVIEVLRGVVSTLTIGYYSSLSDKHGRLRLLMLSSMSTLLTLCSLLIMGRWWDQVGLAVMVGQALMSSLMGGVGIGATMALAYAADCTDPQKRSVVFSWLHAGLFLGLAVGQFLGGIISGYIESINTIIYFDLFTTTLSLLFIIFIVPESLPTRQSSKVRKLFEEATKGSSGTHTSSTTTLDTDAETDTDSNKTSNPEKLAWHSHAVRSLTFFKPNGHNTNLVLLAAISFFQALALSGSFSVIILYTNKVFDWRAYEDGILFSLSSIMRLLSLLVLLPILAHLYQVYGRKKHYRFAPPQQQQQQQDQDQQQQGHAKKLYADNSQLYRGSNSQQTVAFDLENPAIAASVEQLGERVLHNLSADENEEDSSDEVGTLGNFRDRRRRRITADSGTTWASDGTRAPPSPVSNTSDDKRPSYSKTHSSSSTSLSSSSPPEASTSTADETNAMTAAATLHSLRFDVWMIRIGYIINSVTYIGYGLATQSWQFFVAAALHATSIISNPSLKSLLMHLVEPSQFGAALGAMTVVDSVAGIFSPIVISWVYASTVKTMPEFVWYCCGALTALCAGCGFLIRETRFGKERAAAAAATAAGAGAGGSV